MRRSALLVLAALAMGACQDTDVTNRGEAVEPGQEIEDMGAEKDVAAVDLDTLSWFTESGTVEFQNRTWIMVGEPVFDPAVEYVGEYQGTPLYAEVGVAPPYDGLYIPLEGDLWQRLESSSAATPDTTEDTGLTELQ